MLQFLQLAEVTRPIRITPMQAPPKLLLIDDDETFCHLLVEYLNAENLMLDVRHSGHDGLKALQEEHFDLAILDIMLPDINGLDVLRQIRRDSCVAVLMLTARGDDLDRILGLELGADDYLAKPCNPRELTARVHAILRRTRHAAPPHAEGSTGTGKPTLSLSQRCAYWRGSKLDLTSSEYNILATLYEHGGEMVSKAELSRRALGRAPERYDRSLDMHISNLRRKLGTLEDGRSPIQTIHGSGYLLLRD